MIISYYYILVSEHKQRLNRICLTRVNKPHWLELRFTTTDVSVDECLYVNKRLVKMFCFIWWTGFI